MPRVVQPDSAGLQLSPLDGDSTTYYAPEAIPTEDGLEAISGPHTVRLPSYASNNRRSNHSTTVVAAAAAASPSATTLPPISDHASSTTALTGDDSGANATGPASTSASSTLDATGEEKSFTAQRKKHWGLTWRQWLLVVAPSVLILAVAGIVAGVVVSRQNANSGSSPAPSNPPAPDTNGSYVSRSGAFNGTDISLAQPALDNETLWLFYQDFEGNLSYIALSNEGTWHHKGKIPTVNGMANGSAITAFNFPAENPIHINLMYVDSTGQIRNKIYNHTEQQFNDGFIYKKIFTMPPNITTIRRMSWYTDNGSHLFYMYAGGVDGYLHEYTYDSSQHFWQPTSIFAASNGYSGATVTPLANLATIHLVNADGNLQYWTRAPPDTNSTPNSWSEGASSQQMPVSIYSNSTLQLDKGRGEVLFQDTNGEMHAIGFRGHGATAQWNAPVSTGVKARLGTSVKCIDGAVYPGLSKAAHIFMQLNGNDITHLVRANSSGLLTTLETPIS